MSSSRSTRRTTSPTAGSVSGRVDGHDAQERPAVGLQGSGHLVVRRGAEAVQVDRQPDTPLPDPSEQVEGHVVGAAVHERLDARVVSGAQDRVEQRRGGRGVDGPVAVEARGGGDLTGQHRGQRRLVDLEQQGGARDASPHLGEVVAQPRGQRLRQLAAQAVVGQHAVAAGALHRGGQRPRPGHLQLEEAVVALRLLLDRVEVLAQQRDGASVVDAGGVGDAPPGRLQVDAHALEQRERAPDHPGRCAPAGHLGHVDEPGHVRQDDLDGVVEGALVLAGVRPHAARARHALVTGTSTPVRAVAAMVHDPTTRVPS